MLGGFAGPTPRYDRVRLRPGVVHLGVGAFVRAHQALYTEDLLETAPGDWGIIGVSLEPIREVWTPDQRFAERRRSMRRIMARRTKVAALRAWRS
ncbi:MAG TPA: hypothetical protein VEY95_09405 [Azospirillaceae bacterium]|nr:hypothetical protein [Azospirillaceae bacterium]